MKSKQVFIKLVICSSFLVSGCGVDHKDRAASGAAIGAGIGGVASAVVTGFPVAGALLGAGAGAYVGAFTDPETIYLGPPVWAPFEKYSY